MQFRAFLFFPLFLVCLPAVSQTREVTVQQAQVVQVSSGSGSPNIDQVSGNVTYISIVCTNVTICGTDFIQGYQGTYNYTTILGTAFPKPTYTPITWPSDNIAGSSVQQAFYSTAGTTSSFASNTESPSAMHYWYDTTGLTSPHRNIPSYGIGASLDDSTKLLLSDLTSTSTDAGTGASVDWL
jgi:hypothetical protein